MDSDTDEKTPILRSSYDDNCDNGSRTKKQHSKISSNFYTNGLNKSDALSSSVSSSAIEERDKHKSNTTTEVKVYKRRWYILAAYSLYSLIQTAVWQTWAPISNSSERVFGWSDSTIAWLINFGPVAYIVAGVLFPWLLHVKGLRAAILGSALLTSVGCSFRVISSDPSIASPLIYVGHILNGASGPMAMGAMPYLSATWFPVHERVTATAIANSVSYFGTAISFIVGPALVSDDHTNATRNHTSGSDKHASLDAIIDKEKSEIMHYMYYSCGVAWLVTICIIVYFPSKPPLPPCVSAVVKRDSFWEGIFSLRKKTYFICVAITYGMSIGILGTWASVLYINIKKFGVSQDTAGWIGFYATVASCLTGMAVGRFADFFTRMIKTFILVMYALGAGFLIVFTLMFMEVISYSSTLLWVTVICGMTAINGAVPLLFELGCEMAFPTGEGPTTGVLTYINNVFGLVFLVMFSIPGIGKAWMNWMLVISVVLCLPLITLMKKGRLNRLELDENDAAQNPGEASHLLDPTA